MNTIPTMIRINRAFSVVASGLALSGLAVVLTCNTSRGADVIKADNLDSLNLDTSWTNGAPPTASDVAVWDVTVLTAVPQNVLLGADTSWSGIRIADPAGAVAISAGNTLALGAAGIDTSLASQALTLACPVSIGAPQNWNLTTALTVSGVISGTAGNGVNLTGPGQLTISGANNAFVDGITLSAGILNLNTSSTMPVKLNGGQLTVGAALGNPIQVLSSGTIRATANRTLSGAFTGSGTIIGYVTGSGTLLTLNGDLSGFTGTIMHNASSVGSFRANSSAFIGSSNVIWDLGPSGGFSRSSSAARIYFGALAGGSASRLAGGGVIYEVGHLNLDTVFSGDLQNCSVVKVGTGTLTLDGANTFAGGTTISNGMLQIGNFGATGGAGTGGIANNSALVFNRYDNFTFPNAISGTGSVTNVGSGKVTLTGANTYSGATVVAAGGLIFGSSASMPGGITVADGATLGAVVTSAGMTATEGNVSFGTGCTYEFNLGTLGNPTAPLATNTGTVTLNGSVTVNVLGDEMSLSPGTFTLLTYAARGGAGSFVQGTLPPTVVGTINDDTANKRVTLTITSVNFVDPTLQYVGDSAGVWDSDNAANQIWKVVGTGATTNFYFNADALFDDTATGATSIDVSTYIYPNSVTVSNSAKTYTFGGAGTISGTAGLTKRGDGTLLITNMNDYSGITAIEAGTIRVAQETGSIGTGGVTNNGALVIDKTAATNFVPNTSQFFGQITGTGSLTYLGVDKTNSILEIEVGADNGNPYSGGTTISNGYVRLNANPSSDPTRSAAKSTGLGTGMVTFLGDSVLELEDFGVGNASAQWGNFASPINVSAGQSGSLRTAGRMEVGSTLTGSGTFNLVVSYVRCVISGDFSAFTGQVNVTPSPNSTGNQYQIANAAGLPLAKVHLAAGVTMGGNAPLANNSIVPIGELFADAGSFINTVGENARTATFSVGGLNTSNAIAGDFGGPHALTKVGSGTLTLSGANNSYGGATTISNGVLALVDGASLGNSWRVSIVSPGILDVSGRTNGTVSIGDAVAQTLAGDGTLRGSLVVGGFGTVAPGFSIGTLTVTNAVTLGGLAVMELDRSGSPNSDRIVSPAITASGTLVVTNIGVGLQPGDTFQLFSTAVSGSFVSVTLPTSDVVNNLNYTWNTNNLYSLGQITVATATSPVNPTPTNILFSASGGSLNLSWPNNAGWILQTQTNALGIGISSNWVDVIGSESITSTNITMNVASPTVFYRLRLP